jgi:AcrR family transcriptional regulator
LTARNIAQITVSCQFQPLSKRGSTKGTLYRYFSDKEELYLMLLERSSQQFMERLRDEKALAEGPHAQLQAIVAAVIAFFDEHPHLFDLIQRAEVLRDPERASPWQKARDDLLRLLLGLFAQGKRQGEFNIRDQEMVALLLLGGLRSVIRFGEQPRPRDLAQRIVAAFLHGADILHTAATTHASSTEPAQS